MRGATTATIFYEGGIGVHGFGPFLPWFFRVLDFDASVLQFSTAQQFAVVGPYRRRFADVHGFR